MSATASIAQRVEAVETRIRRACAAVGRERDEVTLVAVSKTKPVAMIREAYALGVRDFGENYAQELRDKSRELADLDGLRWHFIGPLQRNKAQYVVGTAALIEAVASSELIERIEQLAARHERVQDVLLQVNISGEASKSGAPPEEVAELLARTAERPHVRCTGLMTMPPLFDDPERAAPIFDALQRLRDEHAASAAGADLTQLSMGMSSDVEVAIAHGATIVRVGSAIFGPRERHR
jgi:pyridoxal phosphate enzyme (YggS family)